ncbi:MAG: glycosyltransferase, partial [Elusimicrobiota bacterium]
ASLARRFGPADATAGKGACKEALRRECGLEARPERPLIGVVSRLDYQKGLDLAIAALEPLLGRVQFVVLGTGDPALSESLAALKSRHPGAVHFQSTFDEPFAHRVYAASDLFLMPSRSEPCGLGQMIAMRYGAVPVAARTGGLVDTVFEDDSAGRSANGFLCAPNDQASLSAALVRAVDAYRGPRWEALVRAAMAGDFSWDRSVESYLRIYRQVARP